MHFFNLFNYHRSVKPCTTVSCNKSMTVTGIKRAKQKTCPYALQCSSYNTSWNLRYNTWFGGSHLEQWQILRLTFAFLEQKTIEQGMCESNVAANTVMDWYNYCREECYVIMSNEEQQIGWEWHILEVDESRLRTRKYHTGRLTFGKREQI